MKRIKYLTIVFTFVLVANIHAQDKGTGLGIIVGEPTGFSAKHWLTNTTAIDGAIA